MSTAVTTDPNSGNTVLVKELRFLVNWIDDAVYLGLMVWVYDTTGINRLFLPLPDLMFSNPVIVQALRYGLLFGSMLELRRWLEAYGIPTDLIGHYLEGMMQRFETGTVR